MRRDYFIRPVVVYTLKKFSASQTNNGSEQGEYFLNKSIVRYVIYKFICRRDVNGKKTIKPYYIYMGYAVQIIGHIYMQYLRVRVKFLASKADRLGGAQMSGSAGGRNNKKFFCFGHIWGGQWESNPCCEIHNLT